MSISDDWQTGSNKPTVVSFRTKIVVAMMLVVSATTALGLYLAQRNVTTNAERILQQNFQTELSSLHKLQELRKSALSERCRLLSEKPRIHAALEDNALDLLYLSAKDELRDLMKGDEQQQQTTNSLHARFYRFLDGNGSVLQPPNPEDVGVLSPTVESQLGFRKLPEKQQIGYLSDSDDEAVTLHEVTAVPIVSTETGETISALVVGFKPFEVAGSSSTAGMKSGVWVNGLLHLPTVSTGAQRALRDEVAKAVFSSDHMQNNFRISLDGTPHLLFFKRLNPDSLFPPAYEICIYPLASWIEQLHWLRLQIVGAGALLLVCSFTASHFVAARLSRPVEQLAIDSEQNRVERERAEAALASTADELERSTRYSADASHQLKSPLTVLRAGLETLLTRDDFEPEMYEELSALLHQTHRLTGVIDDLLLLSRMDAGHLQIAAEPVNLSQLVEEWLDDLDALPDAPDVKIERKIPANLHIAGERQYTSLIVQNLLENARKYNRSGGRIKVDARKEDKQVVLTVGNSGKSIPRTVQAHIFERFHRGTDGTGAVGHGLGLNLALELARLHGGDLRLVQSENDWTEFAVYFPVAQPSRVAI